jgi:hypothetical protein
VVVRRAGLDGPAFSSLSALHKSIVLCAGGALREWHGEDAWALGLVVVAPVWARLFGLV